MTTIKLKNNSEVVGGAAKVPPTLEFGEVAINNATNYESLFLKNNSNSIIKLPINYLKGITSDVQTQLNGKSNSNHTHTFASLTSKPTTLAGYGITDAANKYGNLSYDFNCNILNSADKGEFGTSRAIYSRITDNAHWFINKSDKSLICGLTYNSSNKNPIWTIGNNNHTIWHSGNFDIEQVANRHGYEGYDFNARELRLYGEGIHFLRYGNAAGGWDGADIYIDNEGSADRSKLIFKTGDDIYDSFSFRIANTNPLNIVDTGININGNVNITQWLYGKDALFSGGVQCNGGITSGADVRAGSKARFMTNDNITGWLQLGDGDYKHAVISAYYGNNIDDLELRANNTKFSGELLARRAVIDNLNVSGNLNVYSLTSNQTRVTNGDLWIQNSGRVARVIGIDNNSFSILVEDNVLEFDDLCIIHSKRSFNEIVRVSFSVKGESPAINIDNQSYRVYNCTIISGSYLNIVSGDTVVRVGNKSNKSRQSSILHAASFEGNGAATIYYSNVSSLNANSFYPNASYISSAIGDLKALGYGSASIMTNNGYFKGSIETTNMLITERYRRKTQFIEVDRNVGGIVIDGVATEVRLGELQLSLNDTHIFMRRDAIGLISKLILVEPNDNEVDEVDGTYIKVTVENTTNQNFAPSIISRDKSGRTYTIQWLPTSVNIKGNRMITFEFKFVKQRHKAPLSYDSGWFVHNVYSNISQIQ